MTYTSDVNIWCIVVRNEASPNNNVNSQSANYVLPAMKNIRTALVAVGLGWIKVSIVLSFEVVDISDPSS